MDEDVDIELNISRIQFSPSGRARFDGTLKPPDGPSIQFRTYAEYDAAALEWTLFADRLHLSQRAPMYLRTLESAQAIQRRLVKCLTPLWMRPTNPGPKGAGIQLGQGVVTPEQLVDAFAIVRPDVFPIYRPPWSTLWSSIENRVRYDPMFVIQGFDRATAHRSLSVLRRFFPADWVRARCREAAEDSSTAPSMLQPLVGNPPFPAKLLARTAAAYACKDHGWNILMSLANAISTVRRFKDGPLLLERLHDSGVLYQVLLADHLDRTATLVDVHQLIDRSNLRHDAAVSCEGAPIDIEMKALTSETPDRALFRELRQRARKLPRPIRRPLVHLILLFDTGKFQNQNDVKVYARRIVDACLPCDPAFSALVVAEVFVDSGGGQVKWSFLEFATNPAASVGVTTATLRKVFRPNWTKLSYPLLPVNSEVSLNVQESNR